MRVVLQRIAGAKVRSLDERWGVELSCGAGVLLAIGFERGDDEATVKRAASKVLGVRVMEKPPSKFGCSVVEFGGDILAVPQFTLSASFRKGTKPDFSKMLPTDEASSLFHLFVDLLVDAYDGSRVHVVPFGTRNMLNVELWGPFTVSLEF